MMAWWKHARQRAHGHQHGCGAGASAGCGPSGEHGGWRGDEAFAGGDHEGEFGGGAFGVRRPLRFLAYKLELNEKQVAELAHVLNELKTERAQGAVDHRRTVAGFADAIESEAFDETRAGAVAADRVKSAERLRDAVVKALGRIHKLLDQEQRRKFAYLIRTGALTL
jgi:Spy/CpxP family protein refolding chaperone